MLYFLHFVQDFDVDLEGAQTVRILCYKMNGDVGSLIGTCALEVRSVYLSSLWSTPYVIAVEILSKMMSQSTCDMTLAKDFYFAFSEWDMVALLV